MRDDDPVTTPPTVASLYLDAVESFVAFARTLDSDDWATMVPCTPGWSVRDVLSHVSGSPDDAAAGRMDGAPGVAWTAAQVERNRPFSVEELLERWLEQAPGFAQVIDQIGERRPPIDCHSHEHDIRHALGRPGNRSNVIVDANAERFAVVDGVPVEVIVELVTASSIFSGDVDAAESVTLRGATPFELFRSRVGRRSREQVRDYDWVGSSDAIDAVIDRWFMFGPSLLPIDE